MADVQKNAFMLSSATVMMAPAFGASGVSSVYDLTPALHSIGMVREVAVPVESSLIELKNGVAQATVDSKRTNVSAMISFTMFEFTAANAQRALGLAAATAPVIKRGVLTAALAGDAVTLTMTSDPVPGESTSALTVAGDVPSGSTILIQRADGTDYVFPTKTSGVAVVTGGSFAVPIAGDYKVATAMSFPIGSKVWVIPAVKVAHTEYDDLFAVKIVGTLSNYNRPVVLVAPKVKVSKGFNLTFNETDYGGMPFELKPMLLSATEATGRLSDIGTKSPIDLYIGA